MVLAAVGSEAVGRHRARPLPGIFVDLTPVQKRSFQEVTGTEQSGWPDERAL